LKINLHLLGKFIFVR